LRATPARTLDGSIVWDGIILNVHQSKLNELEIRQSRESLRMLTAHREAVREEERKHIAREIHDELGQALTALKMEVSMIGIGFGRDNPELGEKVRLLIKIINHTIQTVRHVATSLRPAALDLGIESAIEWLAREFCKRHRIEGIIDVPGEGELHQDESEATALVRIVQEALTNIARHSGATRVEISLKTRGQVLCLSVADDGRGFDPEEAKNGSSFGLKGITERVLMLDGTIDIESRPGNGTKLSVCIPVSSGAEPDGANLE
jgi:signal transduction histidine kinase